MSRLHCLLCLQCRCSTHSSLSAYYRTSLFPKLLPTFLYEKLSDPIKCFYILGNCYKMCPIKCFYILCSVSNVAMVSWLTLLYVLRSFHKMFFNILGNCYKMCPIKCFYILCSVSNVAMVSSWLTLLYVLRSPHKMFFNILGNGYNILTSLPLCLYVKLSRDELHMC